MSKRARKPNMHRVRLRNEALYLSPLRGLFWPARKTVFVADVHLGKGATFRSQGVPVPSGSMTSDLARLSRLVHRTAAERLIILGDLFHAAAGMDETTISSAQAWRDRHPELDVALIRGNHDRRVGAVPSTLRVDECEPPVSEGPFTLAHDPDVHSSNFVLAGHLHPGIRLHEAKWSERLPCFHLTSGCAVLPAFSEFTGLSEVSPNLGDQVFVVADGQVIPVHQGSR